MPEPSAVLHVWPRNWQLHALSIGRWRLQGRHTCLGGDFESDPSLHLWPVDLLILQIGSL